MSEQAGRPITLTEETDVRALFKGDGFPSDLDSLDFIEIVMMMEDHFEIELEDDLIETARYGCDFVNLVQRCVDEK